MRREFDYDAGGARVRKRDPNATLITIDGLYELRVAAPRNDPPPDYVGVEHVHNITVEGRIVAQVILNQDTLGGPITSTGVQYLHADAQNSTVRTSTGAGHAKTEFFYDPWGQRTDAAGRPTSRNEGAPRQGYTGHEHDDDSEGLIHAVGRTYDPAHRRFLTTDPVLGEPTASQSLNRYTYVRNNPATHTDPTGLYCWACDNYTMSPIDVVQVNPASFAPEFAVVYVAEADKFVIFHLGATKTDDDIATSQTGPTAQNEVCQDCTGEPAQAAVPVGPETVAKGKTEASGEVPHLNGVPGVVEVRTGEKVRSGSVVLSNMIALEYRGPDAATSKWLQFMWEEKKIFFPLLSGWSDLEEPAILNGASPWGWGRTLSGVDPTSGGPVTLTTDPDNPAWAIDSAGAGPFYEGIGWDAAGHVTAAASLVMYDEPLGGLNSWKNAQWWLARNGAFAVTSTMHFDTYLVQNDQAVYHVRWSATTTHVDSGMGSASRPVYTVTGHGPVSGLPPDLYRALLFEAPGWAYVR